MTDYLNLVAKYVVSSTLDDPGWQNSTVLRGDAVDAVRALKQRAGKDIVLTGSITLAHGLIRAGLVDEFLLFVYPVVQGRGRSLFPLGSAQPRLRLIERPLAFRTGIVLLKYSA